MQKITKVIADVIKALSIGLGVAAIVAVLFTLISLVIQGGQLVEALIIGQRVVILIGAIGLWGVAGMFLKKDVIPFKYTSLMVCIGFLLCAGLLDYWIWSIR